MTQTPAVEAINAAATRPALALKSLGLAPRIKQNKAQKQGLRLVMQLPDGTGVVKVSVYRKTSKGLRFVSSVSRTTSAPGQYRVSMNAPALRRLLRRGNYQVQVTPGYSKSELGTTSKASFRVI